MTLLPFASTTPDTMKLRLPLPDSSSDESSSTGRKSSTDSERGSAFLRRNDHWRVKKHPKDHRRKIVAFTLPQDVIRFVSPEVERLGLQAVFYDNYWREVSADNTCHISVLEVRCFSTTLALSLDTLVLLINGNASGNEDFLHEACKLYPRALQSLRRDLDAASEAAEPFYFMTIIHILQCCELFECIAAQHNDWRKHMTGLKTLMSIVPSNQHRRSAEQAGWILSRQIRIPFGLWNGLMNFDGDASKESLSTETVEDLRLESDCLHIYGRIPEILQHGEFVRRQGHKAKPDAIADVLERLVNGEAVLHRAFEYMYSHEWATIYRTTAIERFEGSLIVSGIDRSTFPHAHSFSDIFTALQHVYYWMCLLALRTMHLNIRQAVGKKAFPFEYDFCGQGIETQTRIADECADKLCMSLAYMSLPTQGFVGLMCCPAPIELAAQWYKRQGDEPKLRWCQAAGDALKSHGFMQVQTV